MGFLDIFFPIELPARMSDYEISRARGDLGDIFTTIDREQAIERAKDEERARAKETVEGYRPSTSYFLVESTYRAISISPGVAREAILERMKDAEQFSRVLMRLVGEKCNGNAAQCYKRAGISRQVYSRLVSKSSCGVSKETALRLGIGLKLSYTETIDFLSKAGYAFAERNKTDAVFAYCFQHMIYNIYDVNDLLIALECPSLTIC